MDVPAFVISTGGAATIAAVTGAGGDTASAETTVAVPLTTAEIDAVGPWLFAAVLVLAVATHILIRTPR